jgi:hypothetical protein
MKTVVSAGIAVAVLGFSVAGMSEPNTAATFSTSVVPFSTETIPVPPQCWIEHTQVQPAPGTTSRVAAGTDVFADPKMWSESAYRLGSEHVNAARLKQSCREQWTSRSLDRSGFLFSQF